MLRECGVVGKEGRDYLSISWMVWALFDFTQELCDRRLSGMPGGRAESAVLALLHGGTPKSNSAADPRLVPELFATQKASPSNSLKKVGTRFSASDIAYGSTEVLRPRFDGTGRTRSCAHIEPLQSLCKRRETSRIDPASVLIFDTGNNSLGKSPRSPKHRSAFRFGGRLDAAILHYRSLSLRQLLSAACPELFPFLPLDEFQEHRRCVWQPSFLARNLVVQPCWTLGCRHASVSILSEDREKAMPSFVLRLSLLPKTRESLLHSA